MNLRMLIKNIDNCFDLNPTSLQTIIIEDKHFFVELLTNISSDNPDMLNFYEETKELTTSKIIHVMTDLINYDLNSKKILTKIISDLYEISKDEYTLMESNKLISNINKYLDLLANKSDIYLEYNEVDLKEIIKSAKFKISYEESYISKLIDYIKVIQELFNYRVFFLLNIHSMLTSHEMSELIEWTSANEIIIIALESKQFFKNQNNEKTFILDEDFCEIY